jgi:hypothetical protein
MELEQAVRVLPGIPPQLGPGLGVQRDDVVLRRRDEHPATIDNWRRFVRAKQVGAHRPGQRQAANVARRDLLQRAESRAVIGSPVHEPIAGIGMLEPLVGHRWVRRRLNMNALCMHAMCGEERNE